MVVSKMAQRQGAAAIETELAQILDDEAEALTIKLWRMLLFEVRRAQAGI